MGAGPPPMAAAVVAVAMVVCYWAMMFSMCVIRSCVSL